jgi:hypothetical protein
MNEENLKKMVKLKMDIAKEVIGVLPPETSKKIISFGRLVLDSIEENLSQAESEPKKEPKDKVNNINIE